VLGDYTRATLDDGNNVPRIPPYRVGGGFTWEGRKMDAGMTLIHYGRQDKAGLSIRPRPATIR
jgi:iron complex outermembrane receptor protein